MSSNQKKICVGLIITILAIVGFYFFYWIKTPAYSINLIREAVKHRNIEAFERHVDLNSVYSKAVDDFFVVAIKKSGGNVELDSFTLGILQLLKPVVVESLKTATIDEILSNKDSGKVKNRNDIAGDIAGKMQDSTDFDNVTIKNITQKKKTNGTAVVTLRLYNKEQNKEFDLDIFMNELENGEWRVKEISNFRDFLMELDIPNN